MSEFSLSITLWYRQNGRKLPWRETSDPYKVWLSEIILQQTRVEQGLSYYQKFVKHYPTVTDLASASEQEILKDWQGLGYYSRARNLHAAAQHILLERQGQFPTSHDEILKLKGVGAYTAAAIASFAFGEPKAVVDGNVYRLLSRCFDIDLPIDAGTGKRFFQELADSLLDEKNPGEHNQAIMELGARVCQPKPQCDVCPLNDRCLGLERKTIASRPVKSKKTAVRDRYFHYLVYTNGEECYIVQRRDKDIWQHLYQFPLIESDKKLNKEQLFLLQDAVSVSSKIVHILSHQRIHARFYHFSTLPTKPDKNWIRIPIKTLGDYPVPRIIDRYLQNLPSNSNIFLYI